MGAAYWVEDDNGAAASRSEAMGIPLLPGGFGLPEPPGRSTKIEEATAVEAAGRPDELVTLLAAVAAEGAGRGALGRVWNWSQAFKVGSDRMRQTGPGVTNIPLEEIGAGALEDGVGWDLAMDYGCCVTAVELFYAVALWLRRVTWVGACCLP